MRMIKKTHRLARPILYTSVMLVGFSGCNREEIHSYDIPKEAAPAQATTQATTQTTAAQPTQADSSSDHMEVSWIVPDAWTQLETTSSMRIATFDAGNGIQIAVTAFPGDVGGLLANVNRWRGQIGLAPADEQGLEAAIERVEGSTVIIVDAQGPGSRLVGSLIDVGDGQTWFAKAVGESEAIGQAKADLIAFSVSFELHNHARQSDPSAAPAANDMQSQSIEPTPESAELAQPSGWTPPSEWKIDQNASSILRGAFFADSGARITLTALMGQGGGLLSNVNRWRNQLGLDVVSSQDQLNMRDLGNGSFFVDIVAPDGSNRMAAGIVPVGEQTLFFKLTGSVEQVESELARFDSFIAAEGLGRTGGP